MTCPKIDGWAVFNDCEVCKVDESDAFPTDYEALDHITTCKDCAAKLGAFLARDLLDSEAYGWWSIEPAIHSGGHVTVDLLRAARAWDEEDE